jgi:hypothetical protein
MKDLPINQDTPTGTAVKHSQASLRPHRDYWLRCGQPSVKFAAKADLDRLTALRGVVTGNCPRFVTVTFSDGSVHKSLHYLYVTA